MKKRKRRQHIVPPPALFDINRLVVRDWAAKTSPFALVNRRRSHMMHYSRRAVLTTSLAVGAVSSYPLRSSAQDVKRLVVACIAPGESLWPFTLAEKAGILERERISFDLVYVGSPSTIVQNVISGAAEFGLTTFELLVIGVDHGAPITGVAGTRLKYSYAYVAAPSIKQPSDLKGTKIALDSPNSIMTSTWNQWAARNGLKPSDYDNVYFGASNARFAAIASGAASVAVLAQPQEFVAEDRGFRKLFDMQSIMRPYGWTVIVARTAWVDKNPDTMRAVNRSLSGGIAYLYDVRHRAEAAEILVQEQKIDMPLALRTYDYFRSTKSFQGNLAIPDPYVINVAESMLQLGEIKRVLRADQYIDRRFCPAR